MTNSWLQMHKGKVDVVIYNCEECRLRSSLIKGMNFGDVIFLLKGSCREIERLQGEVDRLQGEVVASKPLQEGVEKSAMKPGPKKPEPQVAPPPQGKK